MNSVIVQRNAVMCTSNIWGNFDVILQCRYVFFDAYKMTKFNDPGEQTQDFTSTK